MEILIDKNTKTKKFNHHWKFCVGSAHASYALRRDYTEQLKQIHNDLGIERVRFHGIFDDDMQTIVKATNIIPFPFGRSYIEKSFRQCAVAYDNILSAGMKPFVELSFMPKQLAKFKIAKGSFWYKPIVSMPKTLELWQKYIESFVKFLINRYSKEEVESWYFEVWNEPDLPIIFFDGSQKDYFKLYKSTAQAIKRVDSKIKVGGPATSGSRWVKEFINFCKVENAPLDFISTHQYAGDPIGGIENNDNGVSVKVDILAGLKEKNNISHDNIIELYRKFMGVENAPKALNKNSLVESAKITKSLSKDLPLYYTEWNMCASFSAPCNDTSMQGAYLIHTILNTDETIDGSSIWCFSDLFEEFHQFPEEFHGGFGLMTQSGIKKPSYHALQFLNDCGDEIYDLDKIGNNLDFAAFKKDNEIHLILSMLDFNDNNKSEDLSVKIETKKPKKVTLLKIDKDSANPLMIWQDLGSPQVPTPSQIDFIKEKSAPKEAEIQFEYNNKMLLINSKISSNEIQKIIISY